MPKPLKTQRFPTFNRKGVRDDQVNGLESQISELREHMAKLEGLRGTGGVQLGTRARTIQADE